MRRTPESTPCQGRSEFTSDDRDVLSRVAMVCFHCPVRVACREGAEARGESFGVWGGKVFARESRPPGRPRRSVCAKGLHDLTDPAAVYVGPSGGQCRACRRAASNAAKTRKRLCECGTWVSSGNQGAHRRTGLHARRMLAEAGEGRG